MMSEESDRILELTRKNATLEAGLAGFITGVFLTLLIGFWVVALVWPHR
jgi:hypothetical protein